MLARIAFWTVVLSLGACASTTTDNGSGTSGTNTTTVSASGSTGTIAVASERKATAALIRVEATKGKQYGWWTSWEEAKKSGGTFGLPHTFKDVQPGEYILVIYDPASPNYDPNNGDPAQASDGVVFEKVIVEAGKRLAFTAENADFKEWNCLSCPWLFAKIDGRWVRLAEVLKDVVGKAARTTTRTAIPTAAANNPERRLTLRIAEEKREITHLDRVVLKVGDKLISPMGHSALQAADESVTRLSKDQQVELTFQLPAGADTAAMELLVSGWYEPEMAFVQDVLDQHTRTR